MNNPQETPTEIIVARRRSRFVDFFRRLLKEKPLGTVGGIITLILILVAIFADVLAPYPHDEIHVVDRLQGSSAQYMLGTDQLGQDLLSRIIHGARVSLTVGLAATALKCAHRSPDRRHFRIPWGESGPGCATLCRCLDGFPGLLLLLTIMSIVGQGLLQIIVVLGVTGGIGGSRVIRGAVVGY